MKAATVTLALAAVLLVGTGAGGAPAQPGRYKGKGVVEIVADEKLSARQRFEVVGILLEDGTLKLFFPEVPELPGWETRQTQGMLDQSGAQAIWTGTPNDDARSITLTGRASGRTIELGTDAGTLNEPGSTNEAHVFFSFKLRRVGR